jgi:hypothetical protein
MVTVSLTKLIPQALKRPIENFDRGHRKNPFVGVVDSKHSPINRRRVGQVSENPATYGAQRRMKIMKAPAKKPAAKAPAKAAAKPAAKAAAKPAAKAAAKKPAAKKK